MVESKTGTDGKDQQIKELTEELRAVKQELAVFRYEVHVGMQQIKEEIIKELRETRSSSAAASRDHDTPKTPAKE